MRLQGQILALTMLLISIPAAKRLEAQTGTGYILGQVFDSQSGRPLPGAEVRLVPDGNVGLAGLDGRYRMDRVPAGPRELQVTMLGYATKSVTAVEVPESGTVVLDILLDPAALEIEGITVSAAQERGTVARALNEQRTATGVLNTISAEEISRSPDGDAGAAIKRVSGVTVQDGRYVVVRGLGERYTTTSLNGARIPSPEPERKVVPLDMFPSSLLQTITTSKTFTPDLPGDFSGAQVNILTRNFPTRRQFSFSATSSFNSEIVGSNVLGAPRSGREWLADAARARTLPTEVQAWTNGGGDPGQADVNRMVGSFRNAWSTRGTSGRPGGSLSASVGGSDPLFGHTVGYLLSGTYTSSQEVKANHRRAQAQTQGDGSAMEVDRYDGMTGSLSILWGGLLNLSTMWGDHSRFLLNSTFNRTADDEARYERGFSENLGQEFQIDRLRYVEREVLSVQVAGEHQLSQTNRLNWALTRSAVSRQEPDRSEIVYQIPTDPVTGAALEPRWFSASNEGAVRTFGSLEEAGFEGSLDYRIDFGGIERSHQVRVGAIARTNHRDATNYAYSVAGVLDPESRSMEPEEIFDGRFTGLDQSVFRITPLSQGGSYAADDRLVAAYGMVQLQLSPKLEMVAGARVERSAVELDAVSTVGESVRTEPAYTDVLPSVTLNARLSESQNIRLAISRTLARPEYRELANIQYREVIGGDNVLGNPDLQRALITNADLRWEFYPTPDEVLAIAVFAKRFENPVERIYLATSGTRIVSFANAESARNFGVEIEARKGLGAFASVLDPLTATANVTLMSSEIEIGGQGSSRVNDKRAMVDQSPYVVNAGLTYSSPEGAVSATILYNVAGRRVQSAAQAPLPDVYEEARDLLDFSLRFPFGQAVSAKVDIRNLLDAPIELVQGEVVREYYRAGRTASFGVSWTP
jgi:TonB-dependent receptor